MQCSNIQYYGTGIQINQEASIKMKLSDLLVSISWADIARCYFGKSGSWLYHKMDGIDGNGKATQFTAAEPAQLKSALIDLSDRIRQAAEAI